jgi:2-polyprenyl-3-methyl-5-hydroxy-6-metoxy-1,4-benzoquinol methylase
MAHTEYFDAKARTWDDDPTKVERARRVADAIAAAIPALERKTVFEYGSGTGLLGLALQPRVAAVTMADSSREMIAVAREKIAAGAVRNATALELDLTTGARPDARYDAVCTLLALHHIPEIVPVLEAFHALLVPGGAVCIADLDEEDGTFHGPGLPVHLGISRGKLEEGLVASGFRDVRFSTVAEIEKRTEAGVRRYPVFLAIALRS